MNIQVTIQLGADDEVLNLTPTAIAESVMTAVGGEAPADVCYVTINASGSIGGPVFIAPEVTGTVVQEEATAKAEPKAKSK